MADSFPVRSQTASPTAAPAVHGPLGALVLGALGVVYGDIGTSPLYTLSTAYQWAGGRTPEIALGLLSLIVWTLIITTSVKYVALVMRADNDGEGGILALMARVGMQLGDGSGRGRTVVIGLGILGAALLYGDGAITPAISVLSALEGLKVPAPLLTPYILPLATAILLGLFVLQRKGTAVIGRLFGPIMVLWFVTIGLLGLLEVLRNPAVLGAVDPRVGLHYLSHHGFAGFTVLGAVFLSATGAEALYADMGHFGARPIRVGWYGIVLPCLLLNYAGQTALVLRGGLGADASPFFLLAAPWLQWPMVVLATVATIIASQSIISGVFSMTRQAVQLGLCPRLNITQTSAEGYGQIYVSSVNWLLMIFTLSLTLGFGSSDRLAAAFGIAVAMTMLLTTVLMFLMMREQWRWPLALCVAVAGTLGLVDASFVGANLTKVMEGGWVPLVAAATVFALMSSWRAGRVAMLSQLERETLPLKAFIAGSGEIPKVPGTAVYLSRRLDVVPLGMLHSLKHYGVLHERNVILNVETEHVPRVRQRDRIEIMDLGQGFYRIVLHYGFMQQPDIPGAFGQCTLGGQGIDMMRATFFLSREHICAAPHGRLNPLVRRLFMWMHRNAADATEFFRIPRNRIVELGAHLEL